MNDEAKEALDAGVEEINKKHAVILVGGRCVIMRETIDPVFNRPDINFMTPTDFRLLYSNQGAGGQKLGNYWLNHPGRRQLKGIVFDPCKEVPGYYNLWRGFAVEPKEGDCSLYLAHIKENIAGGNEEIYKYIIAWMADIVQRPSERPGTSIVLRGGQGTGKGIACTQFGKLFSQHFVHIQSTKHLVGNFNSHLKDALVVFADEAFLAGNKSIEGILKAMITEEYIMIEPKGKDSFMVKNHIHLLIASNNSFIVPAGPEERRYFVLDVSEQHMQDHGYFKKIVDQMDHGGREALVYYLLHYDLSGVNLRVFPMTPALFETKCRSMSPIQKFWYSKLHAGALLKESDTWSDEPIPVERFLGEYYEFLGKAGQRGNRGDETEVGMELRKCIPWLKKPRPTGSDGLRYYAYKFPPLKECREFWENLIKTKIEWSEEGVSLCSPPQEENLSKFIN